MKRPVCKHLALSAIAVTLVLGDAGCAIGLGKSVHQYALSENVELTGKEKHKVIEAEESQHVFMGIVFDTDFADKAYGKLMNSCPEGRIVNIRAKHSTDLGFMAYENKLRLTATCLQ